MKFEKKIITIGGRDFFYWEKNSGAKEVVVFLHGFPGNHQSILDLAHRLDLKDYRFVIPDLPACGQSDSLPSKHNLENYSQWLDAFLTQTSVPKAVLIGHSFGARLALVFASQHPKKVSKLVLITPVVKVTGLIARIVSLEYGIAKRLPDHLKKMWLTHDLHREIGNAIIFKSASPKKRQLCIDRDITEMAHLRPEINIELFDEFYKFSLIPIGKKVATPSLVIAGDIDEVAPLASVKELAEQLENVTFKVMEHAGHLLPIEEPETTAGVIKNWLEKS